MRAPVVAVAVLLVACATTGPRSAPSLPRVPHALFRPSRPPSAAPEAELDAAIRSARAIYLGEQHDDAAHHGFQLQLLERVHAIEPRTALGLEMLPREAQPILDDYVAGRIDEATLVDRANWPKAWGFAFDLYRPLLVYCRDHRLPILALNAPSGLAHRLAHEGEAALSDEEKRALPEMVEGPAEHRAQLEEAFRAHPHGEGKPDAMARFYRAQLLWDETMAESIARALSRAGAPAKIVVIAGTGHVRRWAVPLRAERRHVAPSLILLPIDRGALSSGAGEAVDFLWVLER